VVVEIAVVEVRLVGDGGGDAVDGGGCHKVAPAGEVVDAVLGVGRWGEDVGVGEVEGVGVGEEVGNGLALDVGQQRVVRVVGRVEKAGEGVWAQVSVRAGGAQQREGAYSRTATGLCRPCRSVSALWPWHPAGVRESPA
jgi:hypothetical protein